MAVEIVKTIVANWLQIASDATSRHALSQPIVPVEYGQANSTMTKGPTIDSMEEALVAYDADGHLIVCNQTFREM